MQLYLDTTVRYLHYAGSVVVAFVLALIAGMSVAQAYRHVTHITSPRNDYLWRNRLCAQVSHYRSLFHQPLSPDLVASAASPPLVQVQILTSTFQNLLQVLGEPLCANFQQRWQCSFL